MSDIRFQIIGVIEKLPSNLTYADVLLKEFRNSKALHQRSADLYVAIAKALEEIVGWCRKRIRG